MVYNHNHRLRRKLSLSWIGYNLKPILGWFDVWRLCFQHSLDLLPNVIRDLNNFLRTLNRKKQPQYHSKNRNSDYVIPLSSQRTNCIDSENRSHSFPHLISRQVALCYVPCSAGHVPTTVATDFLGNTRYIIDLPNIYWIPNEAPLTTIAMITHITAPISYRTTFQEDADTQFTSEEQPYISSSALPENRHPASSTDDCTASCVHFLIKTYKHFGRSMWASAHNLSHM